MNLSTMFLLLWRATTLRCPVCGKGKLYSGVFAMYERCPHCGWRFEREEGYWTGAMAVNLVVTELLIAAFVVPLEIVQVPLIPLLIFGAPVPILLPILFYRHSKSYWMAVDFGVHPAPVIREDFTLKDILGTLPPDERPGGDRDGKGKEPPNG